MTQIKRPKVYIASAYQRRDQMRTYALDLQRIGWEVTSSWLQQTLPFDAPVKSFPESEMSKLAEQDVEDIRRADIFVTYTEPVSRRYPRGGRHVEFGIALALHKPILIVGAVENIFHTLISCGRRFDAWSDLLDWIESNRDSIIFPDD